MAALAVVLALLLVAAPARAVTSTVTCAAAAGTNWLNQNFILSNTDTAAYTSFDASTRDVLSVTNCTASPAVVDGSTITGMQVRVIGCGTGSTANTRQIDLNILNMGTCTAKTNVAQTACGTWTDQTIPASTADLWGCTGSMLVSTANFNNAAFGMSVRDANAGDNELRQQYIEMTVTFTTTSTTTTTIVGGGVTERRLM